MVNGNIVTSAVGTAQSYFYSVIVGIVILLAGFGLGILVQKLLYKLLQEIGLNKIMNKVGVTLNLEKWASNIVSYLIYVSAIVLALKEIGIIPIYIVYLIVGAILTLLALTFLVGLKDIIPNFVGWLYIQKDDKIVVGHKIDVKEISGIIEKTGYLETEIKTENGDILYVPNSLFLKSKYRLRKNKD